MEQRQLSHQFALLIRVQCCALVDALTRATYCYRYEVRSSRLELGARLLVRRLYIGQGVEIPRGIPRNIY